MKKSIKIFGVLAALAMLVSLVVVASPASAQTPTLDSTYYGMMSTVKVTVFNTGWNTNAGTVQYVILSPVITVTNTAVGTTTATSTYLLKYMRESGADTGTFESVHPTADPDGSLSASPPTISGDETWRNAVVLGTDLTAIAAGDTIKAVYGPNTATATVANVVFKKDAATVETWFDIGQSPIVEAATASLTSNIDTLTVNVKSTTADTTTTTGIANLNVILTETTATSGIYRGSFNLVSSANAAGAGELRVAVGGLDTITAVLGTLTSAGAATAVGMTDDMPPFSNFTAPTTDLTVAQTTVGGVAADADSGLAKVEVSVDNGTTWIPVFLSTSYPVWPTTPATPIPTWSYAWITAGDGAYNLKCRAYDKVGNVETIKATVVTLTTTPAVFVAGDNWIAVDVDSTAPVISGAAIDSTILDAPMQPRVSATVTDATSGVNTVTVDASQIGGGTAVPLVLGTGNLWKTAAGAITVTGVPTGTKTLTITATDKVGKTSTATITVTVVRDTGAPTLSGSQVIYPTGGLGALTGTTTTPVGHPVTIKITATDDVTGIATVAGVQILNEPDAAALFGGAQNLTQVLDASGNPTTTWQYVCPGQLAQLPTGVTSQDYLINLQATDKVGNKSAKVQVSVTVLSAVTTRYFAFASGFNNFSVPIGMTATSLEDAFAGTTVTEVYTWVGGTVLSATKNSDGTWANPNKITIDPGKGYIVKADSATSTALTYATASSTAPPVSTITLYQGWNLFSPTFASVADAVLGRDLGGLMASAYGKWSVIYANTGTSASPVWVRITPDYPPSIRVNGAVAPFTLAAGQAYWIYVTAPTLNLV